ncbi:uncharacterized protein LOC126734421 isoform X2 [Anthonomus grandis grandis]|uniref:uncharacterized protein LOC126734421 isoform X2 n=1 Tax=Anthonomus grandis grandis TaxID=2921223 RepID=UPI002165E787|nr:uncharacterized protein LOC126734421 isoform X2 [Anthonomus grandis grandis]
MNLFYKAFFLLALTTTQITLAQDSEELTSKPEITTALPEGSIEEQQTSESSPVLLDSQLRSALLRALSEIEEGEDSDEVSEEEEANVKKAQASAITIFENSNEEPEEALVEQAQPIQESSSPASESNEASSQSEEDTSTQKVSFVLFQKSEALQGQTITSLEDKPLDPFKDAEQIITSASNNILPQNGNSNPQTRSIDSKENVLQSEQKKFQSAKSGFANFNAINNNEGKKASKPILVEKFSIGKAVDEPFVLKSYVKPSGSKEENSGVAYVKPSQKFIQTNYKAKSNSFPEKNENGNVNAATEPATEVSTEENEAKVEQFFTAPLVAAFTVHQDEKGLPKKVEPIYKNAPSQSQAATSIQQQSTLTQQQETNQNILQSPTFNNLDLLRKQQILEQELEKLRLQQQRFAARNTNQPTQAFSQQNFNQAINQNFNQFDPVFTEPDRSIVTKLATLDPSSLVLNRFTPNDAISTGFTQNQINSKPSGDITVLPSISYDPLLEAGKLPENAQILPTKEPTGFKKIPALPKVQNQQSFALQSNNIYDATRQQPNLVSTLVQPNVNYLQQNRFVTPQQTFQTLNNQNRFLRQEVGTANPGFNQNSFSIVPAQQPFAPRHELGYFPTDNRFVRQQNVLSSQQNVRGLRNNVESTQVYQTSLQNPNRFLRSNFEGSLTAPQQINIQQSVQPASNQNRFFRSNLEGNLGFNHPQSNLRPLRSNQESAFSQNSPVLQNYRYSSSFGLPLN